MNDFISVIAFMLAGYLCCVGFVVTMVRVFFPLRTKEEWDQVNAMKERVQSHQRTERMRRASMKHTGQLV
jgi:hypothetical protein